MLIFSNIWAKHDYSKTFQENIIILEMLDKERFFQSDLKKSPFPRNSELEVFLRGWQSIKSCTLVSVGFHPLKPSD